MEFNPLITVINIESYKKENYTGNNNDNDDKDKIKKYALCNLF